MDNWDKINEGKVIPTRPDAHQPVNRLARMRNLRVRVFGRNETPKTRSALTTKLIMENLKYVLMDHLRSRHTSPMYFQLDHDRTAREKSDLTYHIPYPNQTPSQKIYETCHWIRGQGRYCITHICLFCIKRDFGTL